MNSGDVARDRQTEQEFEQATASSSIYAVRNVTRFVIAASARFHCLACCTANQFQ